MTDLHSGQVRLERGRGREANGEPAPPGSGPPRALDPAAAFQLPADQLRIVHGVP
jgi:hypothetical protein